MLRLNDIVDRVQATRPAANIELIHKAYVFRGKVHHGQLRESGEPYLIHPLNVSYILADWNMDEETVVTGLLHDTVEDTVASIEEIRELFGDSVSSGGRRHQDQPGRHLRRGGPEGGIPPEDGSRHGEGHPRDPGQARRPDPQRENPWSPPPGPAGP